MGIDFPLLIN